MRNSTLVDKLKNAQAEADAGTLRNTLHKVLGINPKLYDDMMLEDGDLLVKLAEAIDYEYIERPTWIDGEAVHPGDLYMCDDRLCKVTDISTRVRSDNGSFSCGDLFCGYQLINVDTQERIEDDSMMTPKEYVSDVLELSTENLLAYELQHIMINDLLRRQRELDGRE